MEGHKVNSHLKLWQVYTKRERGIYSSRQSSEAVEEWSNDTVLNIWKAKEALVLHGLNGEEDRGGLLLLQAAHAWSSELNHCITSPICTLSASNHFLLDDIFKLDISKDITLSQ